MCVALFQFGCESMHPIFYILLIIQLTVNRMKGFTLSQLIIEISALKPIEDKLQWVQMISIIDNMKALDSCSWESWQALISQLNKKISQVVTKYNMLLQKANNMIDLNYQVLHETQTEFDELALQLQNNKKENQERINQLENIIQQKGKNIQQLRNILLEKHEELSIMQEQNVIREIELKDMSCKDRQLQVLKHHKRQRSNFFITLEKQNLALTIENNKLKQENNKLLEHVSGLQQYIQKMEEDMALMNIKSPKIIRQKMDDEGNIQGFRNTFNQIDKNSLIDIEEDCEPELRFVNTFSQGMMSATSSFLQKGKPLRDMLNISGQSSTHFNFRTLQKFKESNSKQIKVYSDQNSLNCMNVISDKQCKYGNHIMQIKEFEANEESMNKTLSGSQSNKCKKIELQTKCNQKMQMDLNVAIDPYYAFFMLTIQCLKLNWKDMNEVANVNIKDQWPRVIQKGIPIHRWNDYLKDLLAAKIRNKNECIKMQ